MSKRNNRKINHLIKERINEQLLKKQTIENQTLDTQSVDTQNMNKQRIIWQENDEQLIKKQTIENQDINKQLIKKRVIEEEIVKENLPLPFTFRQLKEYLILERNFKNPNGKMFIFFSVFIILSGIFDLFVLNEEIKYPTNLTSFYNINYYLFLYLLMAYILNLFIALLIRNCVSNSLKNEKKRLQILEKLNKNKQSINPFWKNISFKKFVLVLLTPDLFFSNVFKERIEKDYTFSFEKNSIYRDFYNRSPIELNTIRIY
ncbi:hypothetical protein, partial [Rossellomorea marisflavi]|uniref:hypothetical protein n=1 Tax=Rossellomorea marisflavi TaxID=189381 RepID=UPI00064E8FD0